MHSDADHFDDAPAADDIARRVAARLAEEHHPSLPALTEAAIVERHQDPARGGMYVEPTTAATIASVIVAASQLAWTVYRDIKAERAKKKEAPPAATATRELILRRMRLMLPEQADHPKGAYDRARLHEIVVEEVLLVDSSMDADL